MTLNDMSDFHPQNYVSFNDNKTPNITAISGCNIGCRFCKCLIIKLICGKTGIRTLGTRKGTTVFETVPIDRSGIFPFVGLCVGSCPVGCRFRRLQGCGLLCGLFAGTKLRSFSLFEKFSGSFFGFFR